MPPNLLDLMEIASQTAIHLAVVEDSAVANRCAGLVGKKFVSSIRFAEGGSANHFEVNSAAAILLVGSFEVATHPFVDAQIGCCLPVGIDLANR